MAIALGTALAGSYLSSRSQKRALQAMLDRIRQAMGNKAFRRAGENMYSGMFDRNVGGALVDQVLRLLQNPGQIGPQHKERIQEAQERMARQMKWAMPGLAMQHGISGDMSSPSGATGLPGAMMMTGLLNAQGRANEAYRQLADLEEALRRQDIQMGGNLYQNMMNQVIQRQMAAGGLATNAARLGMQGGAGNSFLGNLLSGIGRGLGMMNLMGQQQQPGGVTSADLTAAIAPYGGASTGIPWVNMTPAPPPGIGGRYSYNPPPWAP